MFLLKHFCQSEIALGVEKKVINLHLKMAGFVFPEVMRTMSSGDWLNTEESESAEKIVQELQDEGILDENKEYTREIERQDSKDDKSETKDSNAKS